MVWDGWEGVVGREGGSKGVGGGKGVGGWGGGKVRRKTVCR